MRKKTYIYIYKYTNNIKIFKNMSANDFLGILSEEQSTEHINMYIRWYGSGDVSIVLLDKSQKQTRLGEMERKPGLS